MLTSALIVSGEPSAITPAVGLTCSQVAPEVLTLTLSCAPVVDTVIDCGLLLLELKITGLGLAVSVPLPVPVPPEFFPRLGSH